jgi:cytochrome c peroxidase
MRNVSAVLVAALVASASAPASADELMQRAQQTFKPIPTTLPVVKGNTVTPEKIELGKMLYFDPRLSASATICWNWSGRLGSSIRRH